MALLHVSHPPVQTCGGEDIYMFLIFPGHPEFWTPLQIYLWGGGAGCTLLQLDLKRQWLTYEQSPNVDAHKVLPVC